MFLGHMPSMAFSGILLSCLWLRLLVLLLEVYQVVLPVSGGAPALVCLCIRCVRWAPCCGAGVGWAHFIMECNDVFLGSGMHTRIRSAAVSISMFGGGLLFSWIWSSAACAF